VPIVSSGSVLQKDQQNPTGSNVSVGPLKLPLIMSPLKCVLEDSKMAAYCVEGTLEGHGNVLTSCSPNDQGNDKHVAIGGDVLGEHTKPLLHY